MSFHKHIYHIYIYIYTVNGDLVKKTWIQFVQAINHEYVHQYGNSLLTTFTVEAIAMGTLVKQQSRSGWKVG